MMRGIKRTVVALGLVLTALLGISAPASANISSFQWCYIPGSNPQNWIINVYENVPSFSVRIYYNNQYTYVTFPAGQPGWRTLSGKYVPYSAKDYNTSGYLQTTLGTPNYTGNCW